MNAVVKIRHGTVRGSVPVAIDPIAMVCIPGGMFEFGTGAAYDGSRFARDGIVCVTINYRVGAEASSIWATARPTSACSISSRPSSGYRRISLPSAVILATSRSSASRRVR